MITDTSREAYHSINPESISQTQSKIIEALTTLKKAHTEQIANFLGLDHSKIWKRTSELCKLGKIRRTGEKLPTSSGRNAFLWELGEGDNTEVVYKKGTETAADIAVQIVEKAINKSYVQPMLEWDFQKEK